MRTDIFNKKESEEEVAKSLLQNQIEYAGMKHPNFNCSAATLNPDRPLTDIPEPAPRYQQSLNELLSVYGLKSSDMEDPQKASMWDLIASPELASHLELLQLGGLIHLSEHFFEPKDSSHAPLLSPLTEMNLLDLSDIYQICLKYPNLTRYGFKQSLQTEQSREGQKTSASKSDMGEDNSCSKIAADMPEMINDLFAPSWETILYPERFDNSVDSLTTDILACSTAVHILKQCQTRQSLNRSLTAKQICQHMRSYVLSQCNMNPQFEKQYRQIRLFEGHVVVAASYLGLKMVHARKHSSTASMNDKGQTSSNLGQAIYLNVSSQSALFTRYPNISSYYINGWS